jgi:hypothetical protein
MAGYNAVVVVPDAAETYRKLARLSWPGVDRLMLDLVVPVATPWALALVCFEVAVASLLLWRGRAVRVGLLTAVAFMIGLTPSVSWSVLANVPLVIGALLLLSRDYDRSVLDVRRTRV